MGERGGAGRGDNVTEEVVAAGGGVAGSSSSSISVLNGLALNGPAPDLMSSSSSNPNTFLSSSNGISSSSVTPMNGDALKAASSSSSSSASPNAFGASLLPIFRPLIQSL